LAAVISLAAFVAPAGHVAVVRASAGFLFLSYLVVYYTVVIDRNIVVADECDVVVGIVVATGPSESSFALVSSEIKPIKNKRYIK
jgi:hypothetical protein